jgi:hypothetical protein
MPNIAKAALTPFQRWEDRVIFLAGRAEIIGSGEFFWKGTETK